MLRSEIPTSLGLNSSVLVDSTKVSLISCEIAETSTKSFEQKGASQKSCD